MSEKILEDKVKALESRLSNLEHQHRAVGLLFIICAIFGFIFAFLGIYYPTSSWLEIFVTLLGVFLLLIGGDFLIKFTK